MTSLDDGQLGWFYVWQAVVVKVDTLILIETEYQMTKVFSSQKLHLARSASNISTAV